MGRKQPPPVTPEPALIPEEAMLLGGALLAASVVHVLTKRLSSSKRLVARVGATFCISYVLGVRFLADVKAGLGVDALGDLDAFGPLWTLSGLLFSVMLGQTYQYYFDRQGAIQDAAFEETLALWRLSQLVTTTINDLHARRSAYVLVKKYAEQLSATGARRRPAAATMFESFWKRRNVVTDARRRSERGRGPARGVRPRQRRAEPARRRLRPGGGRGVGRGRP